MVPSLKQDRNFVHAIEAMKFQHRIATEKATNRYKQVVSTDNPATKLMNNADFEPAFRTCALLTRKLSWQTRVEVQQNVGRSWKVFYSCVSQRCNKREKVLFRLAKKLIRCKNALFQPHPSKCSDCKRSTMCRAVRNQLRPCLLLFCIEIVPSLFACRKSVFSWLSQVFTAQP